MRGAVKQRDAQALAGTTKAFRRFEMTCTVAFPFAWLALLVKTWSAFTPTIVLLAVAVGALLADFISGIVHWLFDTWFTPETPFIGRAFVRTFREHHIDPTAICRHDFIETNGSNMLAGVVLVVAGYCLDAFGAASFLFAGLLTSMTSQIHKWAHAERVPRTVAILQRTRLILTKQSHALHHDAPFNRAYCITSGWLNATLHHVRFFRALEWMVSAVTGALPRVDDIGEEAARLVESRDDVHGNAGIVVATPE